MMENSEDSAGEKAQQKKTAILAQKILDLAFKPDEGAQPPTGLAAIWMALEHALLACEVSNEISDMPTYIMRCAYGLASHVEKTQFSRRVVEKIEAAAKKPSADRDAEVLKELLS